MQSYNQLCACQSSEEKKLIRKPSDDLVKMIVFISRKIVNETFISSLEQKHELMRFQTGLMKLVKRKKPTKSYREEKKVIRHLSLECFTTLFEIAYESSKEYYKFDESAIALEVFLYLHNIKKKNGVLKCKERNK